MQKKNETNFVVTRISQDTDDELFHYGVLGMKWGVRRYRNKDGNLTSKGKKHKTYLDDDETLTRAGKKQMKKLNKLDSKDSIDRYYRELTEHNVDTYARRKDTVSKILTKTNKKNLSYYNKVIEKNEKEIKRIIMNLKSQKVDVVLGTNPYSTKQSLYYKQSDTQKARAKDSKLYKKEGISIIRDDEGRIISAKAKNANEKQMKRINQIITNGYY